MCATLLVAASTMLAGGRLDLKDITGGSFAGESLTRVEPLADGETYAQISKDRKQIVKYSFKTGKQVGVLFDANTVRGASITSVDGYILSPDGKRMLIQTQTEPIYRRSFTAVYYIYTIGNSSVEPLSDGGPQQVPLFSPDGTMIAFVREAQHLPRKAALRQLREPGDKGREAQRSDKRRARLGLRGGVCHKQQPRVHSRQPAALLDPL